MLGTAAYITPLLSVVVGSLALTLHSLYMILEVAASVIFRWGDFISTAMFAASLFFSYYL